MSSRGLLILLLATNATAARGFDPVAVLREADRSRGNLKGVTWEVVIESREKGRVTELTVDVKSRGYDFLGEETAPPKHKGQILLMVSGNMWFYKPGLSKPIPIAQRQRLMGQAANGDIAATNYAEEYDAKVAGEEPVDGEPCIVFDLAARTKKATYDRIRYWVSKRREVGVRAEYYSVSGKRIKTARMEYDHTIGTEGGPRPFISRIVISDALVPENVTTLTFKEPSFRELPDYVFSPEFLGR